MAENLTITNNESRSIAIWEPVSQNELLTFAAAETVLKGTILARDSVSLKMVPFVKGGTTNENGIPKAIVPCEVVATAAGDISISALIGGKVRSGDLVIDADGDASNIDAAVLDQLRDFTIIGQETTQLAELDNQ